MYILKNAIKNLFRNKGRNVIVSLILFIMLTFTTVSIMITSAATAVIDNYKEQFGSEIYLNYDDEMIRELQQKGEFLGIEEISDEMKIKLSESEYLKETQIKVLYQACSDTLKSVGQSKDSMSGENSPQSGSEYNMPTLSVLGYNNIEQLEEFKEGKRKITSGNMFKKDGECVISEEFAKLNNLQVGDTIEIQNCYKNADFDSLKLTISGIFFDSKKSELGYDAVYGNPRNEILTTYQTMKDYQQNAAKVKLYTVDTTYFLKNPDLLNDFIKEAHEKGLPKVWKLSTDEMSYRRIAQPAENLASAARTILIAILIGGSLVIVLLSILSIRERKYEVGVLRAMGMKKQGIVRGLLYESLIMTILCLGLSLSVGAMAAQPISDKISESQQIQSNDLGMAQVETEQIEVFLTADAAMKISLVAIVLIIVSSSAGVLYISRYEPMRILSERN